MQARQLSADFFNTMEKNVTGGERPTHFFFIERWKIIDQNVSESLRNDRKGGGKFSSCKKVKNEPCFHAKIVPYN